MASPITVAYLYGNELFPVSDTLIASQLNGFSSWFLIDPDPQVIIRLAGNRSGPHALDTFS